MPVRPLQLVTLLLAWLASLSIVLAQAPDTSRGDALIAEYFQQETASLADACLADIKTLEDWKAKRELYRSQLQEMLGLSPWPEKTPLEPVITGTIEHDDFRVEKLHFQSRPDLYVTANLYLPKVVTEKLPTILYVCGHARTVENGISFGNKTGYQHHGAWYARNGYVCLVIDTIQLGEIQGKHHGTYQLGEWDWNARGYTPAGVEAWNGIRALDYLETRPEVDATRFGVSGRSGGGAYSWWIAALDERIKAAVPVAGITDLENHVVDGVVDGHCDCMYVLNKYRWDYAQVAALIAPRPLLISNTDKDTIFPLEGVVRVHEKVRRIYRLYGAEKNLGLQITEGPHKDTQELHIHSFRWFNRFLKNDTDSQVEITAVKFFEPPQLRVFTDLPTDERVTTAARWFIPTAVEPRVPETNAEWEPLRDGWLKELKEESFRGWPADDSAPLDMKSAFSAEHDGVTLSAFDFTSERNIRLRLYVAHRTALKPSELELVVLNVLDPAGWTTFLSTYQAAFAEQLKGETPVAANADEWESAKKMFASQKWGMAFIAPRGVGPTAWNANEKKQTQIRRRFQLLGQTLDGMRVWDVRRAAQALRAAPDFGKTPLWLQGERDSAGLALYASLFLPDVARLDLWELKPSHAQGPDFLNVLKVLDVPQAVALAAERSKIRIYEPADGGWDYPKKVAQELGWDAKQIQVRVVPKKE